MVKYFSEILRFCRWFLSGFVRVKGRAMRTELVFYCFAVIPLQGLSSRIQEAVTGEVVVGQSPVAGIVFLLLLPVFIRRMHDQDKSGWFATVLVILGVLKTWEWYLGQSIGLGANLPFPNNVFLLVNTVAFYVLAFWPPSDGINQYGPNPRKRKRAVQASNQADISQS